MTALSETRQLLKRVPSDYRDGDLYQPFPSDHPARDFCIETMNAVADQVETSIGFVEPYEINLLGLKDPISPILQPVITIGIMKPQRLENALQQLSSRLNSTHIHLYEGFPASSSNTVDRYPVPITGGISRETVMQRDFPAAGLSCGLVDDNRHSISLGSYVGLSSSPKNIYALTVPLNIGTSVKMPKGSIVTQPSVADRTISYRDQDEAFKDLLLRDPQQRAATEAGRREAEKSFEFGRVVVSSHDPLPNTVAVPSKQGDLRFETVWDGSTDLRPNGGAIRPIATPSNSWAIFQVTRASTVTKINLMRGRTHLPFKFGHSKGMPTQALTTGLTVSKRGRTTGQTLGTVNSVRSIYRLPRDGQGVRRNDYGIISHPWGGLFGLPGDGGGVIYAHNKADIEEENNNNIKRPGKPCGLIIASSTRGHITYVQDVESIAEGVKKGGLGNMTFLDVRA